MRRYRAYPYLVAALLGVWLSACSYAVVERDAPELGKRYVLTQDLVLTDTHASVPGLIPGVSLAPFAMTRSRFAELRNGGGNLLAEGELTDRGTIARGSQVRVGLMFTHSEPGANIRRAELQFTEPEIDEQTTTYATWKDVAPKLKEVGY